MEGGGGGGLGPVRLVFSEKNIDSIYGQALFEHVVYDLHKVKVNLVSIAMARLCDRGNINLGVTVYGEIRVAAGHVS